MVFSADQAVEWTQQGKQVILVRRETVPDDIHGMFVVAGHSHRHRRHDVPRGRRRPPDGQAVDRRRRRARDRRSARSSFSVGGQTVKEGDYISFDGLTGEVKIAQVASKPSEILQVLAGTLDAKKSDIYQRLRPAAFVGRQVPPARHPRERRPAGSGRASPMRSARAASGCAAPSTCSSAKGRIPIVQRMILADNEADRRKALDELLPLQRDDFYGVFKAMHGTPVTIRTIDPPLHEFLPKREELMVDDREARAHGQDRQGLDEKRRLLQRVEQLHEFNPMLGHRGVRLGITYPEITEMQTRAIIEAACRLHKEGLKVVPEIMIPLVGHVKELKDQKTIVDRVAAETMKETGRQDQVPRRHDDRGAARRDDRRRDRRGGAVLLVRHQRPHADDVRLLARRRRASSCGSTRTRRSSTRIRSRRSTPTASARSCGSGVELGRKTRPDLKLGVCGEHGGDPSSIHFFEKVGLDYVSASPYRIPVARLAAAQAALSSGEESGDCDRAR